VTGDSMDDWRIREAAWRSLCPQLGMPDD
jgi:hypothetical protein